MFTYFKTKEEKKFSWDLQMSILCSVCEKNTAISRCADCEQRNYCSKICQEYDWVSGLYNSYTFGYF